jgi:hypothetical protein
LVHQVQGPFHSSHADLLHPIGSKTFCDLCWVRLIPRGFPWFLGLHPGNTVLWWDYYPQIRLGGALGSTPSPIYIEPYSLCMHNCANMHATPHFVSEKNILTLPLRKKSNLSCFFFTMLSLSLFVRYGKFKWANSSNSKYSMKFPNNELTIHNKSEHLSKCGTKWKTTRVHTISPSQSESIKLELKISHELSKLIQEVLCAVLYNWK